MHISRRNTGNSASGYWSQQELVAGGPTERNWKGIGVSLVVIALICGLIIGAVIFLSPRNNKKAINGSPITVEDVVTFSAKFPSTVPHIWLPDNRLVYLLEDYTLHILIPENPNKPDILLSNNILKQSNASEFKVSSSARYIAMVQRLAQRYRHSAITHVSITDLVVSKTHSIPLKTPQTKEEDPPIMCFIWNPSVDSKDFTFVVGNATGSTMWYQSSIVDPPVLISSPYEKYVFNGIPDWLYEEEINSKATWWSPKGRYIAFTTTNDTKVPLMEFPFYRGFDYPEISKFPYPKVGYTNPTILVQVYDIEQKKKYHLKPPSKVIRLKEHLLVGAAWLTNNTAFNTDLFLAIWSNRIQNTTYFSICDPSSRDDKQAVDCRLIYEFRMHGGWLEPLLFHKVVSTDDGFLTTLPRKEDKGGHFTHVAKFSVHKAPGEVTPTFITAGQWEVVKGEILGYDREKKFVYFLAHHPEIRNRNLFRTRIDKTTTNPECLTCHMNDTDRCTYVSAHFSPDCKHFLLRCKGPDPPKAYLRHAERNRNVLTLRNGSRISQFLATKQLPRIEHGTLYLPDENGADIEARYKVLLPPGLDEKDKSETYPMIIYVYAGPGSSVITDAFQVGFQSLLATDLKIVVGMIDARGSNGLGSDVMYSVYRKLGDLEIKDQLRFSRHLEESLPFVERNNVGIWGWSYGGFTTAHVILQGGNKYFKCAGIVAPVTDFRLYDSAYTERYMGPLNENADGYSKTDILKLNLSAFKQVRLFLAHGTADDNVHFQQSVRFINALVKNSVHFQLMIYPDEAHSIDAGKYHLYESMRNFWSKCFPEDRKRGGEL